MGKKRLLVTASTFPRWNGDTEPRFVLDLCIGLNKYFDVTVLVPMCPNAKEEEYLEGVHVIRYHYFPIHKWETLCYPGAIVPRIKEKKIRIFLVPFLFLGLILKLFKILPQYDYVHAHWIIPQAIIQSFFKKKYIVTGHGADVVSMNKGIMLPLKRRALRNATDITVVSQHLENVVKSIYPLARTHIIPMGCWTSNFNSKYRKENYFHQNGKTVILFVGRLAEKKGVTYLIQAMNNVDAKLVIVGSGPLENQLHMQAKTLGDKIEFLGSKTHEQLKEIYASADIFVAPSITAKDGDQEGFGLVILEAMASGLPVVASNSGGIVDIISNNKNGFLVEEKDVNALSNILQRLSKDEKLREEYSLKSEESVKQWDYDTISKKYKNIIDNMD